MNASNYFKEKNELQNQINLLAAFLSFAENQIDFQKVHFEITYLILKLKKLDHYVIKSVNYRVEVKFEIIKSTINQEYCNTQSYENLLRENRFIF